MQAAAVSLFLQLPDFTALWFPTALFIREIITSAGDPPALSCHLDVSDQNPYLIPSSVSPAYPLSDNGQPASSTWRWH